LQTELKLAFFSLFFQEQGSFSNEADLLKCVEKVGLDKERAREILRSNEYESDVKSGLKFAYQNGIQSVPTYIFDEQYVVTGGQPIDTFVQVLNQVRQKD